MIQILLALNWIVSVTYCNPVLLNTPDCEVYFAESTSNYKAASDGETLFERKGYTVKELISEVYEDTKVEIKCTEINLYKTYDLKIMCKSINNQDTLKRIFVKLIKTHFNGDLEFTIDTVKCHVLFSDFISLPVCDDYFILEKYTRNDRYYKVDCGKVQLIPKILMDWYGEEMKSNLSDDVDYTFELYDKGSLGLTLDYLKNEININNKVENCSKEVISINCH